MQIHEVDDDDKVMTSAIDAFFKSGGKPHILTVRERSELMECKVVPISGPEFKAPKDYLPGETHKLVVDLDRKLKVLSTSKKGTFVESTIVARLSEEEAKHYLRANQTSP
jgi:hypothetical protein